MTKIRISTISKSTNAVLPVKMIRCFRNINNKNSESVDTDNDGITSIYLVSAVLKIFNRTKEFNFLRK